MRIHTIGGRESAAYEIVLKDKSRVLVSYYTIVGYYKPGEGYFRTSKWFSNTTARHIREWLDGAEATALPHQALQEKIPC